MPERPTAGRAVVTRRAVTDIVRTAVLGSYGVVGFATRQPWGYLIRRLGLREPGIRIVLDELRVDVHLRVAYGLPVAEVARQVDSAIRYALLRDLGREPGELTIHVDGLVERVGHAPTASETADPVAQAADATPRATDAVAPASAGEPASAGDPVVAPEPVTADAQAEDDPLPADPEAAR